MGYYLGQARSIGVFGPAPSTHPRSSEDDESDISDADEDDGEDTLDAGELKTFSNSTEECKLVFVVRTDLGMTKGMLGILAYSGAICR